MTPTHQWRLLWWSQRPCASPARGLVSMMTDPSGSPLGRCGTRCPGPFQSEWQTPGLNPGRENCGRCLSEPVWGDMTIQAKIALSKTERHRGGFTWLPHNPNYIFNDSPTHRCAIFFFFWSTCGNHNICNAAWACKNLQLISQHCQACVCPFNTTKCSINVIALQFFIIKKKSIMHSAVITIKDNSGFFHPAVLSVNVSMMLLWVTAPSHQ